MTSPEEPFDCEVAVVGGGPAGLTGAIYLARFKRSVRVLDAGCSRAVKIPRSHNMPGYPQGVVGAELVAAMRAQAERYGARVQNTHVQRLQRIEGGFALHPDDGGEPLRSRLVLLATGASDNEPAMPHLAEAVREGVLRYCPVCDGFEVIGCSVGIVTDGPRGVREALYLRHFTDRLTVYFTQPVEVTEEDRRRLAAQGIGMQPAPVRALRLREGGGARVEYDSGSDEHDSLYGALGLRVHSVLATALGAEHDEDGYLVTDARQQTSIEGLYAAGDVAQSLNQITVATGGAAIAAAAMHRVLGLPG
ncbi:NAD(P)/FAD-dependent oxidoreductase [Azohydromonas caseinilytica]|uniref:NAD(P)/FAD-dependent oxidoreductase n=1 Tax=Azohydromonas caseinilytica TaxID=2728836 RepID=A0A848FGB2_9BURK|nr:NAD(P)/FAD-dependent oxidoreductase [Azohydromonas caseinilytica]NML18488.1 NAD(P)/FAD-dependent oxidoreductase [Azohydromonas caseinilytica]